MGGAGGGEGILFPPGYTWSCAEVGLFSKSTFFFSPGLFSLMSVVGVIWGDISNKIGFFFITFSLPNFQPKRHNIKEWY